MKFDVEVMVVGLKPSKGDMDGRAYDSTKVYTLTSLDTSRGEAFGSAGSEYSWGTSENYYKFPKPHDNKPFLAIASLEIVTSGKASKTIMHDLKPVPLNPVTK